VKTELYTRRLWEQTEKFEYPTYLAMLQSFAKTKTFRNFKHFPRKLTWHLIQNKIFIMNALNENEKRKHKSNTLAIPILVFDENLLNVETNPFFKQIGTKKS